MKDVMLRKYHRDFTLDCRAGEEDISNYDSLGDVQKEQSKFKENEVIRRKDKLIVITDKAIYVYKYG